MCLFDSSEGPGVRSEQVTLADLDLRFIEETMKLADIDFRALKLLA